MNSADDACDACDADDAYRETYDDNININSIIKYECGDCGYCEDCMKNKGSFNYKLQAANHQRIIIQRKYTFNKDNCSICLDELFNHSVSYLPCKHVFHSDCLIETFENKIYSCPLCRLDLKDALNKINFEFPPPQPESLSNLDIHVINQILNPMNHFPYYYYFPISGREQIDGGDTISMLFLDDNLVSNTHLIDVYTFLTSDDFANLYPPPLVPESDSEAELEAEAEADSELESETIV